MNKKNNPIGGNIVCSIPLWLKIFEINFTCLPILESRLSMSGIRETKHAINMNNKTFEGCKNLTAKIEVNNANAMWV